MAKLLGSLLTFGLLIFIVMAQAQIVAQATWTPLNAKGTDVGVGANGVLWVIGAYPAGAADNVQGREIHHRQGSAPREVCL
jgi:hypothetical protein